MGFSFHSRALALGTWASVAVAHGLNCPVASGIFLDGIEPVSPALAGGFLTSGKSGKPQLFCFHLCPRAFLFSLPEGGRGPGILQPQHPCSSGLGVPLQGDRERKSQPLTGVPRFSSEGKLPLGLRARSPLGSVLPAPRALAPVVLTACITFGAQTEDRGLKGLGIRAAGGRARTEAGGPRPHPDLP